MKKTLATLLLISSLLPTVALAQLNTTQGGTGTTSPFNILYGDGTLHLKSVLIGTGLQFLSGVLSATGGSGGSGSVSTSTHEVSGQVPFFTSNSATPALIGGSSNFTWDNVLNGLTITGGATTTSSFATTASSTNLFTSNLTLGRVSGFLKATTGSVATALINLTSDVTGVLPVTNGGTGWAAIKSSFVPFGNDSSPIATSSNFLWDNTNNVLGISTSTPDANARLSVNGLINTDGTLGGYEQNSLLVLYGSTTNQSLAVGPYAGQQAGSQVNASSTQLFNTFVGAWAGTGSSTLLTAASNNTAVGYRAFSDNQNAKIGGSDNTAIGSGAISIGGNNYTGNRNTAIGSQSGQGLSTGNDNFALGYYSHRNGNSDRDIAIGSQSCQDCKSGADNIAIGYQSAGNSSVNVTGSQNIIFGTQSAWDATNLDNVVFLGHNAGIGGNGSLTSSFFYNATGTVAIGFRTGYNFASSSNYNTILGYQAGYNVTTGATNILIGSNQTTGNSNITTGSNNIIIGNDTKAPSATASNQLNIGNLLFGTGLSGTGAASAGKLGVSSSTPFSKLSIHALNGETNMSLFSVASSTQSATTTLFNIANTGAITVNNSSATSTFSYSLQSTCFTTDGTTCLTSGGGGTPGGSNTQIQFNNSSAFGGSTNFVWDSTNRRVGLGTTSPFSTLSIHANPNDSTINRFLFSIASSTANSTSTLFSIDNIGTASLAGTLQVSSTSATALNVQDSFLSNYLTVSTASSTSADILDVATSTGVVHFGVDQKGHILSGGTAPSCGAGCATVVGDDRNMRVTTNVSVSAITVNFANTYTNTPVCIANEESAGVVATEASSTPTTVVLSTASALTTKFIAVHCEVSNNFTY